MFALRSDCGSLLSALTMTSEISAPVTVRVRAAMAADCYFIPKVGEMAEMVRERAASLSDAGTVWAVWHRKDDGSLVLCEFDGCVCYEAYRTRDEALRAAGQANDGFCGGYVAALMPAGLACCIDGEILRSGGGDFEWIPFLDAGFVCVRVAAPNIAFDPAA